MTDRELLELAAKAAGIEGRYASLDEFPDWMTVHDGEGIYYTASQAWNPLTDDGDALRLAVKLGICFGPNFDGDLAVCFGQDGRNITEPFLADPYAATRRAISCAAAEIGRAMK